MSKDGKFHTQKQGYIVVENASLHHNHTTHYVTTKEHNTQNVSVCPQRKRLHVRKRCMSDLQRNLELSAPTLMGTSGIERILVLTSSNRASGNVHTLALHIRHIHTKQCHSPLIQHPVSRDLQIKNPQ